MIIPSDITMFQICFSRGSNHAEPHDRIGRPRPDQRVKLTTRQETKRRTAPNMWRDGDMFKPIAAGLSGCPALCAAVHKSDAPVAFSRIRADCSQLVRFVPSV